MKNCKNNLKGIFFFMICLWSFHAVGQTNAIQGTVQDQTGTPIAGVSVVVKKESLVVGSTSSNEQGAFTLSGLEANSVYSLVFSHVAYESRTENDVAAGARLAIQLMNISTDMDEVVVVGYGTQSRRNVTTSISQYDGKKMEGAVVNSVGDALKGKMGGVRVTTTDMQPGANPRFLIRGGSFD